MRLKDAITKLGSLRFMAEDMDLRSGPAKRVLLDTPWLRETEQIEREFSALREYVDALQRPDITDTLGLLEVRLERVRDIRGSLNRLQNGSVLDDVDFFEIKSFALLAGQIRDVVSGAGVGAAAIPDLAPLVRLLDPEGTRIAAFHVYDAYSESLAELRRQIKTIVQNDEQTAEHRQLLEKINAEEERILAELSRRAEPHAAAALEALHAVARVDILLAKAKQALRRGLCLPAVAPQNGTPSQTDTSLQSDAPSQAAAQTAYKGLFHPEVRQRLEGEGKHFQPVDFAFGCCPALVTGSNMGGKTVLLNMLSLSQYLFQFGFAVPAREASIAPVDGVALCLMQHDGLKRGLSGFAVEMLAIEDAIRQLRSGKQILAVIDEPAQTTNPPEGTALVAGLVRLLYEMRARAVVTTHYSGIDAPCRRMRVRGFTAAPAAVVTPQNIGDYMDYSLTEDSASTPPAREALRVAALLGIDEQWLEYANDEI